MFAISWLWCGWHSVGFPSCGLSMCLCICERARSGTFVGSAADVECGVTSDYTIATQSTRRTHRLQEVGILKGLNYDRNIVQFYGACIREACDPLLITEYMEGARASPLGQTAQPFCPQWSQPQS